MPQHSADRTQPNAITATATATVMDDAVDAAVAAHFAAAPLAPGDPIFKLTADFKADSDPRKVGLGVGAYRDNSGNPWVLPTIKKVAAAQSISGTGAVRLGADFLARFCMAPVYISNPTWLNHGQIFADAGFKDVREYAYWDPKTRSLDFNAMIGAFKSAPTASVLVLHACAHNPTGVDPTIDQWKQIAAVCREKNHVVFFDCAYQGFASGSLDRDAQAVRYFVDQGFEVLIAQSFAKNFGLYNERTGCLSIVTKSPDHVASVNSQLCKIIRANYSNPPAFGARVVSTVLNNPQLFSEWEIELKSMADRIISMRVALFNRLKELGTPGTWNHIVDQIGMFSYTGLNPQQVQALRDRYHVYMASSGRISMAGLNTSNVNYFAEGVDWVVRNVQ
eukprot:jgi/Hompol1/5869/HPOL_000119-RA